MKSDHQKKTSAIFYSIRVKGHLDLEWSEWFDGLAIRNLENGETALAGQIADQTALRGVLNKIWDLGLMVLSVQEERNLLQTQEER